jgi:hypothetical protein
MKLLHHEKTPADLETRLAKDAGVYARRVQQKLRLYAVDMRRVQQRLKEMLQQGLLDFK